MLEARLFSKIQRSENSDCWLWTGMRIRKGYGKIRAFGKMVATHRLMYELVNGKKLPQAIHVLHRCDVPACCNPGHLFEGTNEENIEDKMRKDRSGKKLCIAEVKEVKSLLARGHTQTAIAALYGVHQCSIGRIASGDRWNHVNLNEGAEAEQASAQ